MGGGKVELQRVDGIPVVNSPLAALLREAGFSSTHRGLVAYGGFIGGLIGSWAFLAPKKIRLLAWADDAVPSLASGLLITRIGCYLFGCDFGKGLADSAPRWLEIAASPCGASQ